MSTIKNAVNNSETAAIATGLAALVTTLLGSYMPGDVVPIVGAGLEAVNSFIVGNPVVGFTGLYAAFRLYKKWRVLRSRVAVPAAPPTITGGTQ